MLSSMSADGTAQVLIIDREPLEQSVFDDVIRANTSAGGLHRARNDSSVYAWADLTAGSTGSVYRVSFYEKISSPPSVARPCPDPAPW